MISSRKSCRWARIARCRQHCSKHAVSQSHNQSSNENSYTETLVLWGSIRSFRQPAPILDQASTRFRAVFPESGGRSFGQRVFLPHGHSRQPQPVSPRCRTAVATCTISLSLPSTGRAASALCRFRRSGRLSRSQGEPTLVRSAQSRVCTVRLPHAVTVLQSPQTPFREALRERPPAQQT